jgi:hypothetical protein
MAILTFAQICQIERSAPSSSDARSAFIGQVMKSLPDVPTNNHIADAIKSVLASSAPALSSFGNNDPEPATRTARQRMPLEEIGHAATSNHHRRR